VSPPETCPMPRAGIIELVLWGSCCREPLRREVSERSQQLCHETWMPLVDGVRRPLRDLHGMRALPGGRSGRRTRRPGSRPSGRRCSWRRPIA
jgi:hypothetical protein